jgi:hypothetical protein
MRYGFVLRHLVDGGFWAENYHEFKGFLYATIYKSEEEALANNSILGDDEFEVVKFYKSNKT